MHSRPCCNKLFHPVIKKLAAGFLFFFCFVNGELSAQSYFYFECNVPAADSQPLQYHIFLKIDIDGNAAARVLYKDPVSGENRLVKQNYVDSFVAGNATTRYLVPYDKALNIDETENVSFIRPRFVFKQDGSGDDVYYSPVGIECSTTNNQWQAATITVNQQKTRDELKASEDFVKLFYSESDPFYADLFITLVKGGSPAKKPKLFLIAVANTNDPKIGVTSQIDLDKITQTFTGMCAALNMTMLTKSISGAAFNKKAVEHAIAWLKPAPIDIVIFYYSGHGYRTAQDVSKYPRMDLTTNLEQKLETNNLRLEEDVYNRILKKGALVNIVVGDCCNKDINDIAPSGMTIFKTRAPGAGPLQINMDNVSSLFYPLKQSSILAGSAEPGQLATGNPRLGGFFTNFFQAQLMKSLYSYEGESSWFRILLKARENTERQALTAPCNDGPNGRCVQRAELRVVPLQ